MKNQAFFLARLIVKLKWCCSVTVDNVTLSISTGFIDLRDQFLPLIYSRDHILEKGEDPLRFLKYLKILTMLCNVPMPSRMEQDYLGC